MYRGEEEAAAIERFSNAVKNVREQGAELLAEVECPEPGFALAEGSEGFYLDYEGVNFEDTCASETGSRLRNVVAGKVGGEGEVLLSALDPQETGGLAVEPASGVVYVDNGSSVGAFDPSGSLIRRFGEGHLTGGAGVAVDAKGDVYVADRASDEVDVFTPAPAGPPAVDRLEAQNLPAADAGAAVRFSAQIAPDGADTHYYFQYWTGSVDCASEPGACTDIPAPPRASTSAQASQTSG